MVLQVVLRVCGVASVFYFYETILQYHAVFEFTCSLNQKSKVSLLLLYQTMKEPSISCVHDPERSELQ